MKRGPKTEAGKQAVRLNASKHGILSYSPVIPGMESEGDWLAHRDGVIESLKPEGYLELSLAERVAQNLWRLQRVVRYETGTVALQQKEIRDKDVVIPGRGLGDSQAEANFDRNVLNALEETQETVDWLIECENSLKAFIGLPYEARVPKKMARQILGYVTGYLETSGGYSEERLASAESYLPEGSKTKRELWTALEVLCGELPKSLVGLLLELLADYKRARTLSQETLAARERAAWQGLLPDDVTLARIQRYQAQFHRETLQLLHELEALQSRRRGELTPLARIDVQGVPEG